MRRIVVLVVLVVVAGCRSTVDNAFGSATGNYTLVSVDGLPVPAVLGTTITVRGAISLKGGGDFTFSQADSSKSGTVTNTSLSGQWGLTDNALTLIPGGGTIELGIVTIDTIRLSHASHQNVYLRR